MEKLIETCVQEQHVFTSVRRAPHGGRVTCYHCSELHQCLQEKNTPSFFFLQNAIHQKMQVLKANFDVALYCPPGRKCLPIRESKILARVG